MNRRKLASLMAASALIIGMFGLTTGAVLAEPGDNGMPTGGQQTDLKGRAADVTLAFETNMTINCTGDNTAQQFNISLDYTISGAALPAGSTLVVYLSPNDGAVNNNGGGDPDGYVADVESNFIALDVSGLSGSGTLTFAIPVTTSFTLDGGGVLGVIATDKDGTAFNSKTNSINCGEALGTPAPSFEQSQAPATDTPAPTQEVTAPPTQEVTAPPTQNVTQPPEVTPEVTPSFEQSQAGETGLPTEPNTATVGGNGGSGPASNAWLLVVALGLLLGSVVVLTPAPAKSKTRR